MGRDQSYVSVEFLLPETNDVIFEVFPNEHNPNVQNFIYAVVYRISHNA